MLDGQFARRVATPPGAFRRFCSQISQVSRAPRGGVALTSLTALAVSAGLLAGCTSQYSQPAPIVDMNDSGSSVGPGGTYVVKPGDSLYAIARRNNVDVESLKRVNNIADANHLSVGQVLRMPGYAAGGGTSVASAPSQSTPRSAPLPPLSSKPLEPVPLGPPPSSGGSTNTDSTNTAAVAPVSASTSSTARASDASLISWGWPAQGAISQPFSISSKGIDIAGKLGDPVVAAADGKVMYSGNGVHGLGNLVILNHANGFISAYAHNQDVLVKTGQVVKRGAKIATLGQSEAASPMLHFEIRRQGTPVDPMQYLPVR